MKATMDFYRRLGNTEYKVSALCYGVLTIGPTQRNFSLAEGVSLLRYGMELGINFFDTAEIYGTYPYIRQALKGASQEVVVATKSYAATREEMKRSVEKARREMDLPTIPLFLLHEQESESTLRGHHGALDYLLEAKIKGLVGAVGLSTHHIAGVRAGAAHPEIDVIHPLYNYKGWGIRDGKAEEMQEAIELARQMGKGVYLMKALAGGHLSAEPAKALGRALELPGISSVAIGMQSRAEIDYNLAVIRGEDPPTDLEMSVQSHSRQLHIESWCEGCGRCVARCPFGALTLSDGHALVNHDLCMRCGYCSGVCEVMALKII